MNEIWIDIRDVDNLNLEEQSQNFEIYLVTLPNGLDKYIGFYRGEWTTTLDD